MSRYLTWLKLKGLKTILTYVLVFWRLGSQRSRCCQILCLMGFMVQRQWLLAVSSEGDTMRYFPGDPFVKALILFVRAPSSRPKNLSVALCPSTVSRGWVPM